MFKMFWKIFVLFLGYCVGSVSAQCHLMSMSEECNNINYVTDHKFRAFIPRDEFETTCRNMRIVLDCIYQDKYMKDCDLSNTFLYDMHRDVSNAICKDEGKEYLKHVQCLGNTANDLEKTVTDTCIQPLSQQEVMCQDYEVARECISRLVKAQCTQADSDYMDVLAYRFLGPPGKMQSCVLKEPELLTRTTTTMKPTTNPPIITTEESTIETTTHTMKTTTPKSGTTPLMPSLLVMTILAKMSLAIL